MQSIDQPLNGKILLITGGASGIGFELVKQAYETGTKVLVADIKTTPDFDTFVAGKDSILYVQSDVTRWPDFNKIFNACEKKWNDVPDAYGICAGIFEPPFSNFWEDPEQDEGYKSVNINVNHPIKLTRMAIRKSLGKGKRASVCIIASIAGLSGTVTAPLYCATKHAIVGFVKSMKDSESLTGVKITTLCPASVDTPIFDTQKRSQYSVEVSTMLTPGTCATSLLDMLQKKEYPCGSVVELSLGGQRLIPEWNVSPPEGPGVGRNFKTNAENIAKVLAPIKAKIESERGGSVL